MYYTENIAAVKYFGMQKSEVEEMDEQIKLS